MLNDSALNIFFNTSVSLKDTIQNKNNNFNLVRLGAALIVIAIHSVGEFGNYGILGVPAFFFISGLLVTESLRKIYCKKNLAYLSCSHRLYYTIIVCYRTYSNHSFYHQLFIRSGYIQISFKLFLNTH